MRTILPICIAATLMATHGATATSLVSNTSLTLLFQNNLNASDDRNHAGAILLDPMTRSAGAAACNAINETLLPASTISSNSTDLVESLQYLYYSRQLQSPHIHIAASVLNVQSTISGLVLSVQSGLLGDIPLPVLCTQSARNNSAANSAADSSNQISVHSTQDGNAFVGYRNLKSFRFLGIPYANPVTRFEYSTVYNKSQQVVMAQKYGSDCPQAGDTASNENCLYLNIQTPYIPKTGSVHNLKPVLFSIHGGGYVNGNGGAGLDAGNLASREDIVGVSLNYRLSTLGFLAIPGTDIRGNFGIGDQITALRWVRQNIATFGGDPNHITIIGESAGAGSVKALLGSPPVIAENLIVGAVSQSNLGGGVDLGLAGTYATTYSSYYTVNQSYQVAGQNIFTDAGCTQAALSDQIQCLKAVPASTLVSLTDVARYVVQDGQIVDTEQLIVTERNGSTAHVNVIIGTTANDGASFSTFPQGDFSSEADFLVAAIGISKDYANAIIDSNLFPLYSTGNSSLDYFNVTQRIVTDTDFRCIDEAITYTGAHNKVFKSAYYYTMDRTYQGYDPLNLGATGLSAGPITAGFPYGDPNLPYFRLHGSDLGFTYGNQNPLRDADDLKASQLISGYFASFARTGNPNPPPSYLLARGYNNTIAGIAAGGIWDPVSSSTGPTKLLDYPSRTIDFPDQAQCSWLNYTINYYVDGGR